MGLKEKRITEAFKSGYYETLLEKINMAAGFKVDMQVAWETLFEDRFMHLYNETYPKIYFQPLIEAFEAVSADELGKELMRKGLKSVVVKNTADHHNPEHAISFEKGILTIDHSPVINADKVQDRAEKIIMLLENGLEDMAEEQSGTISTGSYDHTDNPSLTFEELYNQFVALSYEKQLVFSELVGDRSWDFNMMQGTLTFGEYVFPMQILGTYSEKESSWMWAWANKQSGIPENLLQASDIMQKRGVAHAVEELTTASYKTDENMGHYLAQIAVGVTGASCYCPVNFKGIQVFVLINSEEVDAGRITDTALVTSHFTKTISALDCNHKQALYHYLKQKEFKVEFTGNNLIADRADDQVIGIFDLNERLLKVSGNKLTV